MDFRARAGRARRELALLASGSILFSKLAFHTLLDPQESAYDLEGGAVEEDRSDVLGVRPQGASGYQPPGYGATPGWAPPRPAAVADLRQIQQEEHRVQQQQQRAAAAARAAQVRLFTHLKTGCGSRFGSVLYRN